MKGLIFFNDGSVESIIHYEVILHGNIIFHTNYRTFEYLCEYETCMNEQCMFRFARHYFFELVDTEFEKWVPADINRIELFEE